MVLVILGSGTGLFMLNDHQPRNVVKVALDERAEISPFPQIGDYGRSEPDENALHVAIAGVLSPSKTLEHYQELLSWMRQKLGKRVVLHLKPTYAEINDLVRGRRVDLAIVCSLAYVKGKEESDMELLVVPQMYDERFYYSYLIVSRDSSAATLKDLKGATFAFTDPLSNTGYLVPVYQLSLLGETPASFFSRHIFTYNHDNSIAAVAARLVDGAAVDSLIYRQLVSRNAEPAARTRVTSRWGPYGMPPVVVSPSLNPQSKQQLRDFFLELHNSDEGAAILRSLAIDRFVEASDGDYDSIRQMKRRLGW